MATLRHQAATLVTRIRNNPSYAAAVATSYAHVAIGMVIQVAMVPLYLRYLGQYRFGVLMMLLSFVNTAALGVTWLSGTALRRMGEAYAREDEHAFSDLYKAATWIMVGYALVLAVVVGGGFLLALGNAVPVPREHLAAVRGGVVGAAVYFVALYAFNTDRVALTARGQQATANVLSAGSQIVFVLLAVPILRWGGGLMQLMLSLAAGNVLALVAARWHWRRQSLELSLLKAPSEPLRDLVARLGGRAGAGYLAFGVLAVLLQADTLIVGWIAGPSVVAQFVLVWRIAELAVIALWRFADALQPFIVHMDVRGERQRLARIYRLAIGGSLAIGGFIGVFYALAGPLLVRWWVGPANAPSDRWAFALAGGAILWMTLARVPVVFAYATVRLRGVASLMTVEFLGKVALIAALFSSWGYRAPMAAINLLHMSGLAWAYLALGRAIALRPTGDAGALPTIDTPDPAAGPGAVETRGFHAGR